MKLLLQIKALADSTRLRIYNLLLKHELNVNDITDIMGMGQSRISRHLKILSDSGLVTFRRDGLWVFYSAEEAPETDGGLGSVVLNDPAMKDDLIILEEKLLDQAREKTRFYDAIASEWDSLKSGIVGQASISDEIIRRISNGGTAADLGCGTGDLLPKLGARALRVIGVDRSPRMLERARERVAGNGKNIELRIGELEHLPLRDGEADAAVINMVLHHLTSPADGLREAYRVLKPGSGLVIVDLDKHDREELRNVYGHRWLGFSSGEMGIVAAGCGFPDRRIYPLRNRKGTHGGTLCCFQTVRSLFALLLHQKRLYLHSMSCSRKRVSIIYLRCFIMDSRRSLSRAPSRVGNDMGRHIEFHQKHLEEFIFVYIALLNYS